MHPPEGPPAPPRPLGGCGAPPPPLGKRSRQCVPNSAGGEDVGASKAKLKPFFWNKVSANPDNAMVWNQINAGSFQFNEEMMENLLGYAPTGKSNQGPKK